MPTPMGTGPEPTPTGFTPYPYPTTTAAGKLTWQGPVESPMPQSGQIVDWWEIADSDEAVHTDAEFVGVTGTGVEGVVVPQYVFRDTGNRHYLAPVAGTVVAWTPEDQS